MKFEQPDRLMKMMMPVFIVSLQKEKQNKREDECLMWRMWMEDRGGGHGRMGGGDLR